MAKNRAQANMISGLISGFIALAIWMIIAAVTGSKASVVIIPGIILGVVVFLIAWGFATLSGKRATK